MAVLRRLFPFLAWFDNYSAAFLRADLVSGVTVALVLIPQSMAYAQLADLPAYFGLYAAFLPPTINPDIDVPPLPDVGKRLGRLTLSQAVLDQLEERNRKRPEFPVCDRDDDDEAVLFVLREAFSKLKAHLRRIGARPFTEVFEAIGSICELHDPTECSNYFKARNARKLVMP